MYFNDAAYNITKIKSAAGKNGDIYGKCEKMPVTILNYRKVTCPRALRICTNVSLCIIGANNQDIYATYEWNLSPRKIAKEVPTIRIFIVRYLVQFPCS